MTFSRWQACSLLGLVLLTPVGRAAAQPTIRPLSFPAVNATGWNNSTVRVMFFCAPAQPCPEARWIHEEGRDQLVTGSITDGQGQGVRESVSLNIDRTAPSVQIVTPADGFVTRASSIQIVANAFDALSGVASATCGGVPASVDRRGEIRCVVDLLPGITDVVVEATDHADNSGSIGIRVTRTGDTSTLRVVPQRLSVLVGRARTLQVMDEYGPVQDVTWTVDNPGVADVADETSVLTPKAAGVVTVTAWHRGVSAGAVVNVHQGDRLPLGATRWRSDGLFVVQAFPPPAIKGAPDPPMLSIDLAAGRRPLLSSTETETGALMWSEAPAISIAEKSVRMHGHTIGGALLVVEGRDAIGSALVRSGPSAAGTPWRYRSPGRLGHEIVQDAAGRFQIVEVRADGFPELVAFDGRTGTVLSRTAFAPGVDVALNVRCVNGANVARLIPARVGAPRIYEPGIVLFEVVATDDLQDYGVCDQVSGRLRRTVSVVMLRATGPELHSLGKFESPAGSSVPEITLLPVASDGRGGFLAPWIVSLDGTGPKPQLGHITPAGVVEEFPMPAVGEIVRWNDLASMSDGTTLVTFKAATGEIKWTRVFPGGGARILPGPKNGTLYVVTRTREVLDEFGRPVK
jgi:hypothetical protein